MGRRKSVLPKHLVTNITKSRAKKMSKSQLDRRYNILFDLIDKSYQKVRSKKMTTKLWQYRTRGMWKKIGIIADELKKRKK